MQKAITNIDKKIFFIFLSILFPAALCAQEAGLQGISSTADGLGNYIPIVQGLCFVIAAAVGIAGSVYAYYQVQKGEQPEKYVVGTVGSAMTFVVMALFLPQFFGYTSSPSEGLIARSSSGGDSTSAIDTEIPEYEDPRWMEDVPAKELIENYAFTWPPHSGYVSIIDTKNFEETNFLPLFDNYIEKKYNGQYPEGIDRSELLGYYSSTLENYTGIWPFSPAPNFITEYITYQSKLIDQVFRFWTPSTPSFMVAQYEAQYQMYTRKINYSEFILDALAHTTWWEATGTQTDPPPSWYEKF